MRCSLWTSRIWTFLLVNVCVILLSDSSPLSKLHGLDSILDVTHKTRKSAQTGVQQRWRLRANDGHPRLCPIRALIQVSLVYGKNMDPSGPLWRQTTSYDAVDMTRPVVSVIISLQMLHRSNVHLDCSRAKPCTYQAPTEGRNQGMGPLWNTLFSTWWLPVPSQGAWLVC